MFSSQGRVDSTHLMIVITDGKSDDETKTVAQANTSRNSGIRIVAVGVANYELKELQGIADSDSMVLFTDNFDNLASIVGELQSVINETVSGNLEGTDGNSTNEFSQCQLGFSAHYSENLSLFVGAVGSFDRAGSLASYQQDSTNYVGLLSSAGLEKVVNASSLRESYAGYSVSSGKFFGVSGSEFVVSGTPRYESRGTVLIMSSPDLSDPSFSVHPYGEMWQLGAYFGHSVLGVDLNNDGFDDLMVSAPLHSHQAGYDHGRVFVFMNDPKNPGPESWTNPMYKPLILYGSATSGSRFGSTIEIAGDLDNNGYKDIIVGAPLEGPLSGDSTSQNSGAVYVYYLSSDGISDLHRQRILGSDLHSPLLRFGGSVATSNRLGYDINDDGYPDVMVGAPSSDSLLLLRSRPIVDVSTSMTLNPDEIDVIDCVTRPGGLCSTARFCITAAYRVNPALQQFPFEITANLDARISNPFSKRLLIVGKDTHLQTNSSVQVGQSEVCLDFQMLLNVRALGKLGIGAGGFDIKPTINVTYQLIPDFQAVSFSPVLDRFTNSYLAYDWSFQTGCTGDGGICNHDLSAVAIYSLESSNDELILTDRSQIVSVNILIRNAGPDYSYFTKINITSGALPRSKVIGDCVRLSADDSTPSFTVLEYVSASAELEDLMLLGAECNFTLEFDLGSMAEKAVADEIEITGVVYSNAGSVSSEINTENNKFRFQRLVAYSASLIYGSSASPDEFFFNRTMSLESSVTSLMSPVLGGSLTDVRHSHAITSTGPLMVAIAPMKFTWPGAYEFLPLFYLYQFNCEPAERCTCDTTGKVNSLQLSLDNKTKGATVELEYPQPSEVNLPLELTCDDVTCGTITCTIQNMTSHRTVYVTASFKVWLPTLTQPNLHTKMFSDVTVDTTALPLNPEGVIFTKRATTTVREFVPPEPISGGNEGSDIGAIIGGVLGGIALLCIIVIVLWKVGFFKSKYGERTREAREMEGNNEPSPYQVAE
uniref:Integrin alpha-2-like n=1 Tax=Phallusia mammillata TaxID=59560 RepID=A0A6F9DG18_9ASCI|nr:integrin alpha-2-like [Phallusia mammillata]